MTAIRRQGTAFCAVAIALSGGFALAGPPDSNRLLPALALLIVALGIPHGALDAMLAASTFGLQGLAPWALFAASYLALVLLVMTAWQGWPLLMLASFLLVSVSHFSGDPEQDCPRWLRLLYGGAPIVLPVLRYREELQTLFSMLAPAPEASRVVAILNVLAWPWLIGLSGGTAIMARRHWPTAAEIGALTILSGVAPPLVSFTIYFCGMHSARHILRCFPVTVSRPDRGTSPAPRFVRLAMPELRKAAVLALPPMAATLLLLWFYWAGTGGMALEPRVIRTLFVSLAALTLPHVILVDWIRPAQIRRPA